MARKKQILRINSAPDIIGLIPYVVGFKPECSLVALGLRPHGEKFRMGFTVRSDLPGRSWIRPYAEQVIARLTYHGIKTAIFVVYADEGALDYDPAQLVDVISQEAALRHVSVHDALLVANGRWRSYTCTNPACCPPDGTRLDDSPSQAEVKAVTAGLSTLPSWQALVDTLRPASEIATAATEQELQRVAAAAVLSSENGERRGFREESLTLVKQLLDRHTAEQPVRPTPSEAARVLVGLVDLTVRDLCMCWARGRRGRAARALWTELVRLSVPPFGAAPATLLAYVSWQQGDGTFANVALERALAHDPTYSMAHLLGEALERSVHPRALPPERLRAVLRDAGELC